MPEQWKSKSLPVVRWDEGRPFAVRVAAPRARAAEPVQLCPSRRSKMMIDMRRATGWKEPRLPLRRPRG